MQYSNYESGRSEITLSKFLKIAFILDLEILNNQNNITNTDIDLLQKAVDNIKNKM